ncbi:MNN10 [Symbiodinium sp. CCMP2456]|nr:MNN10 [Symbiodinium sp. CCMP2456]
MARWYNTLPDSGDPRLRARESDRQFAAEEIMLHRVEYTIAVTQLHAGLKTPQRAIVRFPAHVRKPRFEVHSICNYRPDPTSQTGANCPLPELSVPNHRAYSERHEYKYVLHEELPLPDREAHYSKMLVIHQAFLAPDPPDWVFFIDCDAFFTDARTSLQDILETYGAGGAAGPHFLVAEDPGGINTGTLLFRRSEWSLSFLEQVASSQFAVAWDQSMFFWEILKAGLLAEQLEPSLLQADYMWPPEVALVHQAHLNAYVPPASTDWSAHEWREGDFVRHFAGCPWQEPHCLGLMRETAKYSDQQHQRRS